MTNFPETVRRDYLDAYQVEFDATLLALTAVAGRPALVLDASYFYPTSGGQPHDLGTLGGWPVVDVVTDAGVVYHLLEAQPNPLPTPGPVHGALDWPRRYDHMQQHSGQHLLSQTFYQQFGYETVSVHFGALESTLDLDAATVSAAELAQAEGIANDLVYAAKPIHAYFVEEASLGQIPLRRPPKVRGQIRIVEIDGYDYSACGGTHVHTTAEIGPIKLTRQERRRGQTRLTFLCGKRALADYVAKHDLLTQAAAVYSTEIAAVPDLLARGQEQVKTLQRQVEELTAQLLVGEAAQMVATARQMGQVRVVVAEKADMAVEAIKTLANLLQAQPGTVALLATVQGGRATMIFARSPDVDAHMGNLLRDALKAFGGGGGGRPDYAQGGGIAVDQVADVLAFARQALQDQR
jgi:alanyl-tRNA synthetase